VVHSTRRSKAGVVRCTWRWDSSEERHRLVLRAHWQSSIADQASIHRDPLPAIGFLGKDNKVQRRSPESRLLVRQGKSVPPVRAECDGKEAQIPRKKKEEKRQAKKEKERDVIAG
jgi:hypothetical protein